MFHEMHGYGRCTLLKLMLLGLLATSTIAVADIDDEYFIAHQVAQSHQIPQLLKGDTKTLTDDVIVKLLKDHKQKALIKRYHEDKATSVMLQESIEESVSSAEFDSWLNEKIATIYTELYDVDELRLMYKDSRAQDDKDKKSDKMTNYLSQYIHTSLSHEGKKESAEQSFLKKLKEQTQHILDQYTKPDGEENNDDEYY